MQLRPRLSDIEAPLRAPASQYDNTAARAMKDDKMVEGVEMYGTDEATIVDVGRTSHFTWVHPPLDWRQGDAADIVARTAAAGTTTIVEAPHWASANLKKIMDAGALGIAAPGIHNAEEARQFVEAIKYPPEGVRGVGPAFSTHYLRPGNVAQAVNQANAAMLGIVVVDTPEAVAHIESIAAVPGIDVLFVDTQQGVERIEAAAREHHVALGARVAHREDALALYDRGYRMVSVGNDRDFIDGEIDAFLGSAPRDPAWEAAPRAASGPFDNPLRQSLAEGKMSYGYYKMGTSLTDAPLYQDRLNFDWQDGEHMPRTPADVLATTQANQGHAAVSTVRIPRWDLGARPGEIAIHEYLDAGAKAIICPQVETPEQARAFLSALQFAPSGTRPVTDTFKQLAAQQGLPLEEAMKRANASVSGAVMIETDAGLRNREAIIKVLQEAPKGSAWLHIGPYDLRLSLSRDAAFRQAPPAEQDRRFAQAVADIEASARDAAVPLGGLALNRSQAHDMFNRGYRVLTVASDQEGVNNSPVMQDLTVFPPTDRRATLDAKAQTLARFDKVPWQTLPDGRRQQVVSNATGTWVHLLAPPSSGTPGTFSHPAAQQTTLLSGETRVKVGSLPERTLVAGETVVIGPGIPHAFTNTTATEVVDAYYPPRTDLA